MRMLGRLVRPPPPQVDAHVSRSAHGTLAGHRILRGGPRHDGRRCVNTKVGSGWSIPKCPWWAKLRRAESLIDEIRHASRRSTEQRVAGRLFGRC
jgi:hypothetical protein